MIERKIAQKYFAPREVRFSIAMIILWSLLVTAFFTFIAVKLSASIGQSPRERILQRKGLAAGQVESLIPGQMGEG